MAIKSWGGDHGIHAGRVTPVDEVDVRIYERGWDLISTGHTTGQILVSTGLTRVQLDYLTRHGAPHLGLESYTQRLTDLSAAVRKRAHEAVGVIGDGALEAIKREIGLSNAAANIVGQLISTYVRSVLVPAQKLVQGEPNPKLAAEYLDVCAMPRSIRETLKALQPYARIEPTARAYRLVFDAAAQAADPTGGASTTRVELSPEKVLPASFALVEGIQDNADPTAVDPLDLLDTDWAGWTLEEIEHYSQTGELPDHAYGDRRPVEELPDECLDQDLDPDT